MKKLVNIPFGGFYHSYHSSEIDSVIEGCEDNEFIKANFDTIKWPLVFKYYANKFTDELSAKLKLDMEFESLSSPKYYNYETDRIFAYMDESAIRHIYESVDRNDLEARIKERFTSCSGFISHYPNSLYRWHDNILEWDHNQLGTLLELYIENELGEGWEVGMLEGMSEHAYLAIEYGILTEENKQ